MSIDKDFKPITLSSFPLKTLERIIDVHIRESIDKSRTYMSQYAYTKGQSVETALHSLVGHTEISIESDNLILAAFLDIKGAFNGARSINYKICSRVV